jgi:hypothetical protein
MDGAWKKIIIAAWKKIIIAACVYRRGLVRSLLLPQRLKNYVFNFTAGIRTHYHFFER